MRKRHHLEFLFKDMASHLTVGTRYCRRAGTVPRNSPPTTHKSGAQPWTWYIRLGMQRINQVGPFVVQNYAGGWAPKVRNGIGGSVTG